MASISETTLQRINAPAASELQFEHISNTAHQAQMCLSRLTKLVEELRVKAHRGDKRAKGLLVMISDEACSLYAEAIMDLEGGR